MSNIVTFEITKTFIGDSTFAGLTTTDTLRADKRLGFPFTAGQVVKRWRFGGGYRVDAICIVEGGAK